VTTANKLALRALSKLRVHTQINPASTDAEDETFVEFQGLLAEYKKQNYDFGLTVPTCKGDDLNEPADVLVHLPNILADRMALYFGVPVSQELSKAISKSSDYLQRHYHVPDIPKRNLGGGLMGAGNSRRYQRIFFPVGANPGSTGYVEKVEVPVEVEHVASYMQLKFSMQNGDTPFTWTLVKSHGDAITLSAGMTDVVLARSKGYEYELKLDGSATPTWVAVDIEEGLNGNYSVLDDGNLLYVGDDVNYPIKDDRTGFFDVTTGNNQLRISKFSDGGGVISLSGELIIKSIANL